MKFPPTPSQTVLVVEDDAEVRALTICVLEREGYNVLSAEDGQDAVRLINSRPADAFALVLSDLMMPDMGGEEMAAAVCGAHPALKFLFTSGYSQQELSEGLSGRGHFIPKPWTPSALIRAVRAMIDNSAPPLIDQAA